MKYQVETPVFDIHTAKDNPILVHPEEDWKLKIPLGGDNKRNLCASAVEEHGDVEKVLSECKYTVEHTYHTRANQQTMMETFRTACYLDHTGRLIVLSSTQIPFHVRRIVGRAWTFLHQKFALSNQESAEALVRSRLRSVRFIRQL